MTRIERKEGNEPGQVVLELSGNLTAADASAFRDALQEILHETQDLVLDLSALEDLDLAGIQVLMAAERSAEDDQRRFAWRISLNERHQVIIDVCGFDTTGNTVHR